MEKVKNIGIVILVILLIIIASLEGFYIVKSKDSNPKCNEDKTVTIYKGHEYLVENINIELPDYIVVNQKGIINGGYNLLLAISSKKNIENAKIVIKYYDDKDKLVSKDEQDIGILLIDNVYYSESIVPKLLTSYSGKINVTMESNDFDASNYNFKDKNKLNLKGTIVTSQENNSIKVKVEGTNPYSGDISYLSGYALLYKDEQLVASSPFNSMESIKSSSQIYLETYEIYNEENIKYDKVEVVVNYLY